MFRPDACLGPGLSEPLQAFMPVALDHSYSVCTHYTKSQGRRDRRAKEPLI
jgi:hypothetical protein